MKSNELRIGNLIRTVDERNPSKGDVIEVTHELLFDIAAMERRNVKPPYFGVELTEDWLLEFGFLQQDFFFLFGGLEFCIKRTYDDVFVPVRGGHSIGVGIKYVHQLQNLFFALTNEELKRQQ